MLLSKIWDRLAEKENPYMFEPLTEAERQDHARAEEQDRIRAEWKALTFYESKGALRNMILQQYPQYTFTPQHTEILRRITRWVWNMPDDKRDDKGRTHYDLYKGFLIIGIPGTGKTTLMEIISRWTYLIGRRHYGMCYAKEESDHARNAKATQVHNKYFRSSYCIDEIGHERAATKVWGNEVSYIGDLLEHRYSKRLITHGTTNIDIDETATIKLSDIYNHRVVSRMHAMFNVMNLNGQDWRKSNNK